MMGRNTRPSTTRLWTGIVTVLLVSGFASSQNVTALDDAASTLYAEAERSTGSVASLHNVDTIVNVPSTTLKNVEDVPEAGIEGTIVDELPDSFTTKSNGTQKEQSISSTKSEKLKIQEPITKVAGIEEKLPTSGSLSEFSEHEDNGEIEDLEGANDREPTTPPSKKDVNKEDAPKDPKRKEKEPGGEKSKEKVPEIGVSLLNDTNVNYNGKKPVKDTKDEGVFGNDSNSPKSALENATNVIASGADAADGQEKGKGPKAQVEIVKNSTLPKVMRFSEAETGEERKEVDSHGSAEQSSVIETSESTVNLEPKDLADAREKTNNLTLVNGSDSDVEKINDNKAVQSPKGRTISFGGTNEFVAKDNKTGGSIRNDDGITDRSSNQMMTDVTKEPVRDQKSTDFKPYPYVKTNYQSNSSEVPLIGNVQVLESTEEASALENTIGQRQQNKKFVVTEPSVVIDNSIQHFKPTYYKRSGNSTRIPSGSGITIPTVPSIEGEGKSATTLSSKSIALENDTTLFASRLPVSNTENDVPRGQDEAAKSSVGDKDTSSSLDLTGNGITEVIAGIKNVSVVEYSATTASIPFTSSSISTSRATEKPLVQNTTEKIALAGEEVTLTNSDTQTNPEKSITSIDGTEGITSIAPNQNDTNVINSRPTLMPETSSQPNSTSETPLISTLTPKTPTTSTLMPENSFELATNQQSSPASILMVETSTKSPTTSNVSTNSNSMAYSESTSIPTMSLIVSNVTSASPLITELEVQTTTFAPEGSTDGIHPTTLKTAASFDPTEAVESTTSKIEYVFVGLSESTTSQQYIATSESSNAVTLDRQFASSTPSSVAESSTLPQSFAVVSTTVGISSNGSEESSVGTEKPEQFSADSITPIAENDTSEDSTTIEPLVEITTLEDSTISKQEDTVESTTTVEDAVTTLANESVETTTEGVTTSTNSTNLSGIIPEPSKNTTDTGRAVDSFTSIPDVTGTMIESSSETIIGSTEAPNVLITSEVPELSEVPQIPNTNVTLESPSVTSTSERSFTNVTSKSSSSSSTFRKSSTKPMTSSVKPDVTTISGDTSDVGTDDSIEISTRGVPSLVKVIFEGSWADVCPHMDVLRQSLADLLTSGLEKTVLASQIIFQNNPCSGGYAASTMTTELSVTTLLLYVVDEKGNFDSEMTKALPSLYSKSPIKLQVNIRSFQLVQDSDSGNAIAVIVVSCVALICLIVLAGLLFIMRKRQTRFNYGERCRPVSLDAYSLDSVSAYNSVRRKGAARASKRSYGNPTFEDSSAIPSHPLNFAGLSTFCNEQNAISEEFAGIPQVTARIDELPQGAEVKNRYANVVPLPETRVALTKINNDPLTEYINASYVRGPKNATKYYIACQAPIESTVTDFWRMIWEQQSKVVIMLTDLVENGVEKCAEYIPPSEVTDCHRLFGDFQVTLKKRETKEKYAISTLHLKNLENNTFREISHIWYLWPANGVQSDAAGLIAVLLEARALQRGGPGPIVVHCSPGTGRTGTLIALDLGIRQYEITRTVDVPRVVYTIRRDRAGAVQTKEQYAFIYKALNLYATKLAGGALES